MRLSILALVVALAPLGLTGCSTLRDHWPQDVDDAPVPSAVRELQVIVPPDAQVPIVLQFRERNTLVVDLTSVASQGSVVLRPGESGRWPARLALRFQPGRFEAVEVRGAQRVVFPVTDDRKGNATVGVPPAVHPAGTDTLTLRWGSRSEL